MRKQILALLSIGLCAIAPASAEDWGTTYWPELDFSARPICQLWGREQLPTFTLTASPTETYLTLGAYTLANSDTGASAVLRFSDASTLKLGVIEKPSRHWAFVFVSEEDTQTILDGMAMGSEVTIEIGADSVSVPTEQASRAVAGFRGCMKELRPPSQPGFSPR